MKPALLISTLVLLIGIFPASPVSAQSPVQDAQAQAVRLYPDLAVKGSPLNAKFVSEYQKRQTANPGFFKDPSWPLTLAKECSDALNPQAPGGATQPAAVQNPADAGQALTSSLWQIQIDQRPPAEFRFFADGTAKRTKGKGVLHWAASGPQSFTINGKVPCTFDGTFTKFIGLWSNKKGKHTTTGVRLAPGAQVAETVGTGSSTGGIVLSDDSVGDLTEAAGGQTMKMDDLEALLSGYGTAESDTGPHPNVTVYEGPTMDSNSSQNCRIPYLMPLPQAEALLFRSPGIGTEDKAVAPGFPDGLNIHAYDVRAGIYNRLVILTDGAKPDEQVVSIELVAEGVNRYPASPPFKKVERD